MTEQVQLTAELIEAFAGTFLSARYDDAKPTPNFHRECWALYASSQRQCGAVAPRGHAKSTALTYDYILAEVCFRSSDYVILIGSTEDKAAEQLSNISEELHTNMDLRREFGIAQFESEQKTEIIVRCDDGHRFRVLARGAEQKIRGAMWKGKRPNLIVCDDMEDDEQVDNKDRRRKFRRWFFRAAKQSLSKSGKIRVHGTILHEDSLLSRLRQNSAWRFLFYKAHASYSDFSHLLWEEQWPVEDLKKLQREFEDDSDSAGYSQEYLNEPRDNAQAYLREDQFLPMRDDDFLEPRIWYAGADFAVSTADSADQTSFTAAGIDSQNIATVEGQWAGRVDTGVWIDKLFEFYRTWLPELFFVEDGVIWKAVWPTIQTEMRKRDCFIPFEPLTPIKDKAARGRAFQKRMQAHSVRFNKDAEWYPGYEDELLKFTGSKKQAAHDDQFDSTSTLFMGIERQPAVEEDDFIDEDELEIMQHNRYIHSHRESCTGYG